MFDSNNVVVQYDENFCIIFECHGMPAYFSVPQVTIRIMYLPSQYALQFKFSFGGTSNSDNKGTVRHSDLTHHQLLGG